jgi:pimeloyl-ACP methyl ester carboxylesterase
MTTWILLRGLTRESRHWGTFPALLRSTLNDAQVIALDLTGNGRFHAHASPSTVEGLADACRAELRRAEVKPPFYLLGLSLGAMVTVAWAAQFPREIRGCVLINTSMRPFGPFYWRLRPASYGTIMRLIMNSDPQQSERLILRLTSHLHTSAASIVDEWRAYRREFPVSRSNALRQLVAAGRFRAPTTRPVTPLLVLASTHDALVDVRCSRRLAKAWLCDFAEHPRAGHDLPLDDPQWVAQMVGAWATEKLLTGTPRAPSSNRAPAGAGSRGFEHDPAS